MMEDRLSLPEDERSSGEMQDYSISSIISNVSKLLEGNNSSFLVHVNSSRLSSAGSAFADARRTSDYEGCDVHSPDALIAFSNESSSLQSKEKDPSKQLAVNSSEKSWKINAKCVPNSGCKQILSDVQRDIQKQLNEGEKFNLADIVDRISNKQQLSLQATTSNPSSFENRSLEHLALCSSSPKTEETLSNQMHNNSSKLNNQSADSGKQRKRKEIQTSSRLAASPKANHVDMEKNASVEKKNDNEQAEDNETEFLFADIMKNMQNPLPLRRFPPPALPAIFEQSYESFSMSSRSRSSSTASVNVKKPSNDRNVNGCIPESGHNVGHMNSIRTSSSLSDGALLSLSDSLEKRVAVILKRNESKIPLFVHGFKSQKDNSQPESISQEKNNPMDSSALEDTSSFVNWTSGVGLNSTVLMVDSTDPSTITFGDKKPLCDEKLTAFDWMNQLAGSNLDDVEYQRRCETDSWDEFDKIMDKSVPPKDWEIHEFEELALNKNQSIVPEQEVFLEYVSSDEAKLLMDKEEEERAQFLKSANNSFASTTGRNSAGLERIPMSSEAMSMTNYFQCRSSFPVDNCANDSSMFHDESLRPEDKTIQPTYFSDNDSKEITVMPSTPSHTGFNSQSHIITTPSFMLSLDSKTKDLAQFLVGEKSRGIEKASIMDYVLDICKRQSNIGVSEDTISKILGQRILQEKNTGVEDHKTKAKGDRIKTHKNTSIAVSSIDNLTKDTTKNPKEAKQGKNIRVEDKENRMQTQKNTSMVVSSIENLTKITTKNPKEVKQGPSTKAAQCPCVRPADAARNESSKKPSLISNKPLTVRTEHDVDELKIRVSDEKSEKRRCNSAQSSNNHCAKSASSVISLGSNASHTSGSLIINQPLPVRTEHDVDEVNVGVSHEKSEKHSCTSGQPSNNRCTKSASSVISQGSNASHTSGSLIINQPLPVRTEHDVDEVNVGVSHEKSEKHSCTSGQPSNNRCTKSASSVVSQGSSASHTSGSCAQSTVSGSHPPAYGFPVTIHIHLPNLPYSIPYTHHPHAHNQHNPSSSISSGIELPAFQTPFPNICNCNNCSHMKT